MLQNHHCKHFLKEMPYTVLVLRVEHHVKGLEILPQKQKKNPATRPVPLKEKVIKEDSNV